jgi:hypothetical protein
VSDTGPGQAAGTNLGYKTFLNGTLASNIVIDQSFTSNTITATNKLCVSNGSGDENPVCVTKAQLASLLASQGSGSNQSPSAAQPSHTGATNPPESVTQNSASSHIAGCHRHHRLRRHGHKRPHRHQHQNGHHRGGNQYRRDHKRGNFNITIGTTISAL